MPCRCTFEFSCDQELRWASSVKDQKTRAVKAAMQPHQQRRRLKARPQAWTHPRQQASLRRAFVATRRGRKRKNSKQAALRPHIMGLARSKCWQNACHASHLHLHQHDALHHHSGRGYVTHYVGNWVGCRTHVLQVGMAHQKHFVASHVGSLEGSRTMGQVGAWRRKDELHRRSTTLTVAHSIMVLGA